MPSRALIIRPLGRALVPLVLAPLVVFGSGGSPASAASVEVPVAGKGAMYQSRSAEDPFATLLVHEIRRVPGGSVLYYSLGVPEGNRRPGMGLHSQSNAGVNALSCRSARGDDAGVHYLVAAPQKKVYTALCDAEKHRIATEGFGTPKPGAFGVLWQAFPELPSDVSAIDVVLSNGVVVKQVPVGEGELTPVVEPNDDAGDAVLLGTGWPQVDLDRIASAPDPSTSIVPLIERSSDLKQEVRRQVSDKKSTVDLASDVLFAVDSAKLSPAALSRIKAAAKEINATASGGVIQVVGHTDSTGSTAHNRGLSKQRAAAVAKVLKPLITVPGAKLAVAGKGESDPVADNKTAEGRKLNRRVSMTFATKGDS